MSYRHFTSAMDGMEGLGLVEVVAGGFKPRPGPGEEFAADRPRATRFRATLKLVVWAEEEGIDLGHAADHFVWETPCASGRLLVLKTSRQRRGRVSVQGQAVVIPETAETRRLKAQVETLNAFLSGVRIDGAKHTTFFRQFELGDLEGFAWNKGGRLYSEGRDSYQQAKRGVRLGMTLNGEPVVEVDVKASFLALAHGLTGYAFDPTLDPYDLPGVPREVAKAWATASLSQGKPLTRWPGKVLEEYAKGGGSLSKDHPVLELGQAMRRKHPLFNDLSKLGLDWGDLMFHESEVILRTMVALMGRGVPSLPVHDSLILPRSREGEGLSLLASSFEAQCGVRPALEVSRREGPVEPS